LTTTTPLFAEALTAATAWLGTDASRAEILR